MLQSKLTLARVPWVCESEDGVSVARDDLAVLEGVPDKVGEGLLGGVLAQDLANVLDPEKDLLVGQAVQGPSEAGHACRKGEVRVRERAAHEVRGVRAHVAALVVAVDGLVQPHQLQRPLRVKPHHVRQVGRPVQLRVRLDQVAAVVGPPVDQRRDRGQLGDQVHAVLEVGLPVLRLVDAGLVGGGELAVRLQREDGLRELSHGVRVRGHGGQHLRHVRGQRRPLAQVQGNLGHLLLRGHLPRHQQPQHALRQGLAPRDRRRQRRLALGDRVPAEPDAVLGVQQRRLPQHAINAAHSPDAHVDGDVSDDLVSVGLLDFLEPLLLCRDLFRDDGPEVGRESPLLLLCQLRPLSGLPQRRGGPRQARRETGARPRLRN
mmetsp:Transcript_7093/g.17492  ORF Transcript_7093/g.17492 Transcript_7093/m.17492 type:complete len:376 (-) Transcript_7093:100-1227(-)